MGCTHCFSNHFSDLYSNSILNLLFPRSWSHWSDHDNATFELPQHTKLVDKASGAIVCISWCIWILLCSLWFDIHRFGGCFRHVDSAHGSTTKYINLNHLTDLMQPWDQNLSTLKIHHKELCKRRDASRDTEYYNYQHFIILRTVIQIGLGSSWNWRHRRIGGVLSLTSIQAAYNYSSLYLR